MPIRILLAEAFVWASIVGLFSLCHVTRDVIAELVTQPGAGFWFYLPSLKGMLFLGSVGILVHPIVTDTYRILTTSQKTTIYNTLAASVGVAALLALLTFHFGNASMGMHYALESMTPFDQETGWYNKRLFMPAIAHILFFRGNWLYYIFSNLIFLLFLNVLYSWVRQHTGVKWWHFLSLSTCSFVLFQYQFPGYPDILVYILFVLVMTAEFSQKAKFRFLLLALVTHEHSIFIGPILAYRYLNSSYNIRYLTALVLYGSIWFAVYEFNAIAIFENHHAKGMSGLEWVFLVPHMEFLGVFIAFKAVWILPVLATIIALRCRLNRDAIFIVGCICGGLLMTLFGVDTSRHMGAAFPGILVALQIVQYHMSRTISSYALSAIFAANIIIPSFYVGLNTGIIWRPGLYRYLYSML